MSAPKPEDRRPAVLRREEESSAEEGHVAWMRQDTPKSNTRNRREGLASTLRNQIRENTISVHCVPGMRVLAFDFGAGVCVNRRRTCSGQAHHDPRARAGG
eukprot:1926093-Rhodomonas_salina.1